MAHEQQPPLSDPHILATLTDIIPSGIWLGAQDLRIPLWKTGQNIQFSAQGVEKVAGNSAAFTTAGSTPIRGMTQLVASGIQELYFGNQTTLYKWNSTTETVVGSGFTGNLNETATVPASIWSMKPFGAFVLATNGIDIPQIKTGASFANLTGIDFTTAEIFVKRGPHMLAFNTSINEKGFVWSDEDDVQIWQPSSVNAAGDLVIRELDSAIIAAVPLGDRIAVYGKDQMFLVGYVGAPFYFGYTPGLEGIGAVSKKSVVVVGRKNYGISRQGPWETDGASFKYIDDPQVKKFIQDDVNWNQSSKINGYHDEENHQIKWYYPSVGGSGEVDKGLIYDYQRGLWSPLAFGETSSIDRQVFTNPVIANSVGDVLFDNFGNDADGAALTSSVRSSPQDFGSPERIKEIETIRFQTDGTGLRFRIGTQFALTDSITWTSFAAIPTGYGEAEPRVSGRYISIEVESIAIGDNWDLVKVEFFGRLGGDR